MPENVRGLLLNVIVAGLVVALMHAVFVVVPTHLAKQQPAPLPAGAPGQIEPACAPAEEKPATPGPTASKGQGTNSGASGIVSAPDRS